MTIPTLSFPDLVEAAEGTDAAGTGHHLLTQVDDALRDPGAFCLRDLPLDATLVQSMHDATTAFFPGPSLDKVVVDRGPGTASNLGNATFGGTVALYSAPTTDKPSGEVSAMYGSGATWQVAGSGNTGVMNKIGTEASINYSHIESNGLIESVSRGVL